MKYAQPVVAACFASQSFPLPPSSAQTLPTTSPLPLCLFHFAAPSHPTVSLHCFNLVFLLPFLSVVRSFPFLFYHRNPYTCLYDTAKKIKRQSEQGSNGHRCKSAGQPCAQAHQEAEQYAQTHRLRRIFILVMPVFSWKTRKVFGTRKASWKAVYPPFFPVDAFLCTHNGSLNHTFEALLTEKTWITLIWQMSINPN